MGLKMAAETYSVKSLGSSSSLGWIGVILRPIVSTPDSKPLASSIVREDEPALVAAARAGDLGAFEELVNRYERKIFRLAMNITGNREDAEDVMQEAFLKSYSHLREFQGDSRFYTWLVRSEEHTSELQSRLHLVCRLLLEKKKHDNPD